MIFSLANDAGIIVVLTQGLGTKCLPQTPLSHFQGVAVGDGLTDGADSALESGVGEALEIVRTPAMSGVSIIPKVSMTGRVLRFLVGVQRSDVTPPMRILESPLAASVSTRRTSLPGLKK